MSNQSFEALVAAEQHRHASARGAKAADLAERESRFVELTQYSEMMQFLLRCFTWMGENGERAHAAARQRYRVNSFRLSVYLEVIATSSDNQWVLKFGADPSGAFRVHVFSNDGSSDDLPSRSYYVPIGRDGEVNLAHSTANVDEFFAALTNFTREDCVEGIAKLIRDSDFTTFRG